MKRGAGTIKGAKNGASKPKRLRWRLKTKKALPEPNPTAPPPCFYLGNECLSPSKLMLRKGVNDEGKRPPEGGKKRPSTAAGRSVDAQEKDGVGTDE